VNDRHASVHIPPALRSRTNGRRVVEISGTTVGEVVQTLDRLYPGLGFNICHETGELRRFVNIFLDGEDVRHLGDLDTPVPPNATIHILHSVAGG
jgi:molybdopterin synthase sulfur carrier subunit